MYYAIYRHYGKRTMSGGDTLHRFGTRAERDKIVDGERYDGRAYHWRELDRETARHYYPRAFSGIEDPDGRERWTMCDSWTGPAECWTGYPTGGEYRYING